MPSRRNFLLGVINGICFSTGFAFTSPTVVLPWYVSQLTSANVLVGLLPTLQMGGWFLPQLLFTRIIQRRSRKLPFYRASVFIRSCAWGLLTIVVLLIPGRAEVVLPALLLLVLLSSLCGGFGGLAFYDIVARIVPAGRLPAFFAVRSLFGGLGAL